MQAYCVAPTPATIHGLKGNKKPEAELPSGFGFTSLRSHYREQVPRVVPGTGLSAFQLP